MFGDMEKIDEMREKLNGVSPSFCMAKWMHVTVHLMTGHTHSCYLPLPHKIPLREIKKNPSALHNTKQKKKARKQMLEGKRPEECRICWDIEDLSKENYSDRHYRGVDDWTMPYFNEVKNLKWDANINPSYMEVSFSSACNFKCMYCAPTVSTAWMQEVKRHGPIKLSKHDHQSIKWLKLKGQTPLEEENNPYLEAFWKWWPDLVKDLMYFRITGGEPLLSPSTFKVLEWLNENPQEKLDLSINSNLGIPPKQLDKFLALMKPLVEKGKIKRHILHTSLDTWGVQAEYIRTGLVLKDFEENLEKYLNEIPNGSVAFMCTFNGLSVVNFIQFLEYVLSLRKRFNTETRQVLLDIPHLQGPEFFSAQILTSDYCDRVTDIIQFMKDRQDERIGIKKAEILKMERILSWMQKEKPKSWLEHQRRDFYLYFKEHDKRRETNFLDTFPEMKEFWFLCEKTYEQGLKV